MRLLLFAPIVLFLIIAGFLWFSLGQTAAMKPSPLTGKKLPVFTVASLTGGTLSSEKLKFPAVVNIFASWCGPCIAEHPLLTQLGKETGIPIYGIAWRDKKETLVPWLEKHGNPYKTVGVDMSGEAAVALGVSGVPETYIIDRSGNIVFKLSAPITPDLLESAILPQLKALQ